METHTRSPRDLFEGKEHYEIPAFQRPYVWSEEEQWAPLWDDVRRVAESVVAAKVSDPESDPEIQHFMGAVVYESKRPIAGDVTRHEVIDGQQRMTTIQILLDAVHEVIQRRNHEEQSEALQELIINTGTRFKGKKERFKLWPSQADRKAFEYAMDAVDETEIEHRIVDAHKFFGKEADDWISGAADDDGLVPPGDEAQRVEALSSTLQYRLVLVAIDLTGHDDAQLIFETLNDRGTPLLKADLIKNWIFRKGEKIKADVSRWADDLWAEFDGEWWRTEVRQGRLTRSRIDIFLHYWLTMRRQDEIKADQVFRIFTEYADPYMRTVEDAERLLKELRRDADTFHDFSALEPNTPEGQFYWRVIERLDMATTTPVFLWMLSVNHKIPSEQRRIALEALESWAIRRMLLRLTSKDVNKFVIVILKMLDSSEKHVVGDSLIEFLRSQTAETRKWPTASEMKENLPQQRVYGYIRQDRLRVIFSAVERHLRTKNSRYEAVSLPEKLEIEHLMPQGWRTLWDTEPKLNLEKAHERERLVNSLGNLTLVTKSLNGSLSNRPWTDKEALGLKEGGEPGLGKHSLLESYSLLILNKEILTNHPLEWTEGDIKARSISLIESICEVWTRPEELLS
ncbi:DUF262 domain-containing HNH endonuclease family protein [Glutamicibacter sp. JL.03c]|uniref:DUF262 domain-containing protein n=1 Tax=Glutamicibacter sp. JL.03c TaxID=2984842 RepID=UPI0021F777C2|nr:DUF262 domain-containing protein [Glutamicibacter sp. JL.03c]UYQ76547.1 DUF262 domain-containing HNH endonuclease family protein [Glutamicibacter sp. JL.03c]